MPSWQGELESLLATLNVSLEGAPPPRGLPLEAAERAELHVPRDGDNGDQSDDAHAGADSAALEVVPVEGDEVRAVGSEIEATIREVVALVRAGRLERAVCDDVILVLDALTRPGPRARSSAGYGDASQEWELASAAAVLRFCRIVSRMTRMLARERD
jgi:hypothetical protein